MGLLESMEERLRQKGKKLTPSRKVLLRLLVENRGKSLSAQEIYQLDKGSRMDFSTIYRNLEMMTKEGILSTVRRENGTSGFELCLNHHHHHLICTDCGATRCIDICPMDIIDKSLWEGFTPKEHRFEIIGVCRECSQKE